MNVLRVNRILYYRRGAFSGLELYTSHDWIDIQNTHDSLLSKCHFVRTLGHNLQIIRLILAFYIPNDLATIGDVASRLQRCMRASTGKLCLQTRIAMVFSFDFTHSFRTIRRIPAFYITNDFFTVMNIPFQPQNLVLVPTGKLRIAIAFLYDIFCVLKHKLKPLAATTLPNDSPATKGA